MNKARREKLQVISLKLVELQEAAQAILDEEQEAFEAMPEGIQQSELGDKSQYAINDLDSVVDNLESAINFIDNALV